MLLQLEHACTEVKISIHLGPGADFRLPCRGCHLVSVFASLHQPCPRQLLLPQLPPVFSRLMAAQSPQLRLLQAPAEPQGRGVALLSIRVWT